MGAIKDLTDMVIDLNKRIKDRQYAESLLAIQSMILQLGSEQAQLIDDKTRMLQEISTLKEKINQMTKNQSGGVLPFSIDIQDGRDD